MSNKIRFTILCLATIAYITGLFLSYPYLLEQFYQGEGLSTIRNIFEYTLMFLSLITFCSILLKYKYSKLIAYILLFILSLNFLISTSCFFIYKSGFNTGMAISILDTNPEEVSSMSRMFVLPIILSLIFFLLVSFSAKSMSMLKINNRYLLPAFAFLWLLMPFIFHLKHKYIKNKGGGHTIKNVYYHLSNFQGAIALKKDIDKVNKITPKFELIQEKEGIENVILIIGESQRRKSMSLYGYNQKNTPNEDNERGNMFIYNNAVSSAGITNLSVPLMLSLITPQEMKTNYEKLAYNIVNFAKQAHYDTYWYSTQGGAASITAIASASHNKKWVNGYDEVLLPYLKETITRKRGKKFIVLHINGSHPDPCTKYPQEMNKYGFNCYDTSILYTDKVIGEIFKILKNTNSAIVYTSDHAVKFSDGKFLHIDSKESTEVPLYVWYANQVPEELRKVGTENKQTSNTIIYPILVDLMGYKKPIHNKYNTTKYLTLEMKEIDYETLGK